MTSQQRILNLRTRTLAIAFLLVTALLFAVWQNGGIRAFSGPRTINAAAAPPHFQLFLKVVGKKQGTFKGDGFGGKRADQLRAFAFAYGIVSPRDLASGQASGKRQHQPVVISKEWGPSMPQFLEAAATNEVLTMVTMEFVDNDATGVQRVHFTVKLTDASVSEVKQHFMNDVLTEDLTFTFRKIEVEDKVAKTVFVDDWQTTA